MKKAEKRLRRQLKAEVKKIEKVTKRNMDVVLTVCVSTYKQLKKKYKNHSVALAATILATKDVVMRRA